jgi:hypothetical protein
MSNRPSDFVTQERQASRDLLAAKDRLHALRAEYDAAGYSGTLTDQGAFVGDNADVTEAEVAAVIGVTLDALDAWLASGHGTNLYAII